MPRQIQLSEKTLKKIAECLFLAYTAEQAAYIGGISERTLARIRKTPVWLEIQTKALAFEKPYRQKVWQGLPGWQGAAWMLERKYPSLLARPEIQLQVNASSSVTNNTIVISAEQAQNLRNRSDAINSELGKLVTPSTRHASSTSSVLESAPASVEEEKASAAGSEEEGHHSPARTPGQASGTPDPNLPGNSRSGRFSSNSRKPSRKDSSGSNGTESASGKLAESPRVAKHVPEFRRKKKAG